MSKKKSGVLGVVVGVSAAVAALTTLAVLALRFFKKQAEEEFEGEVFDYTFDGETEAVEAESVCACEEEGTEGDAPAES